MKANYLFSCWLPEIIGNDFRTELFYDICYSFELMSSFLFIFQLDFITWQVGIFMKDEQIKYYSFNFTHEKKT